MAAPTLPGSAPESVYLGRFCGKFMVFAVIFTVSALAGTELLTNAFRHALQQPFDSPWSQEHGRIRLGLLSVGYVVLCAVTDPSSQAPVLRQPDWLDESGRGLHLVASLSDDWGYCAVPQHPGKVVWATFTTTRCPQPDLDLGPG